MCVNKTMDNASFSFLNVSDSATNGVGLRTIAYYYYLHVDLLFVNFLLSVWTK